MKDTRARIERIDLLNERFISLELALEDPSLKKIKPGQSLLARLGDRSEEFPSWALYTREQWWPVGVTDRDVLRVELPRRSVYEVGQVVQLLGPVGQPFRFRPRLHRVVLIAYNTAPTPLSVMTPLLVSNKVNVTLLLMGEARSYNTRHLPPEVEVIKANDRLEWPDMVRTMPEADQVFAIVGRDDELGRFKELYQLMLAQRSEIPENYAFGVFQSTLLCGVGSCDACTLHTRGGIKRICTDGPMFDLTAVRLGPQLHL